MKNNKGIFSQLNSTNNYNSNLKESDIINFISALELKTTKQPRDSKGRFIKGGRIPKEESRKFVMCTGLSGMFNSLEVIGNLKDILKTNQN